MNRNVTVKIIILVKEDGFPSEGDSFQIEQVPSAMIGATDWNKIMRVIYDRASNALAAKKSKPRQEIAEQQENS